MARQKPKQQKKTVSLPSTDQMVSWSLSEQLKVFQRMVRHLVPDNRRNLKKAGSFVAPPVELEVRITALSDFWADQARQSKEHPDYFEWPSTKVWLGDGDFTATSMPTYGVLSMMGYNANRDEDLTSAERRKLLAQIFSVHLPSVQSYSVTTDWGAPSSAERLLKMANCLATFARNAKRRHEVSLEVPISKWESDLSHLRREYYVGKFRFDWPETSVDF